MKHYNGFVAFGDHQDNTLVQMEELASRTVRAALLADGHYGYVAPVGSVSAYRNQVSVVGVGFDIACGNCAIKTNLTLADITRNKLSIDDITSNSHYINSDVYLNELADKIAAYISFGIGRSNLANDAPDDHAMFLDPRWYIIPNIGAFRDDLRDKARKQLGTVGSGNHYVDVFVDRNDGHVWVGVHFGSRGLGHTIASNYLAIGQGGAWGDKGKEVETLLGLDTQIGQDYWSLMELAGEYAYAGREWVARKVVELIGGEVVDMVHNHHNFAWKETHAVPCTPGESFYDTPLMNFTTEELVVVRKGATPAFPGQKGFIGGSMGDDAVIIEGTDPYPHNPLDVTEWVYEENIEPLQQDALYSTVHGAGRVMSRTAAAGKRDRKSGQLKRDKVTGEIINAGAVTPTMMNDWLQRTGVVLRGGGLDESPQVYRRLPDVLAAQGETITILNTLKPVIVVMAGATEFDPYAD